MGITINHSFPKFSRKKSTLYSTLKKTLMSIIYRLFIFSIFLFVNINLQIIKIFFYVPTENLLILHIVPNISKMPCKLNPSTLTLNFLLALDI